MKTASSFVRESLRVLKPCVHGADVLDAANKSGVKREDILDFSSSVNPLGPSVRALEAVRSAFGEIPSYPDSCSSSLRDAIAGYFGGIGRENVVVGNGSTELIYLFAESVLGKGDVALVPAPSFGEYEGAVRRVWGKIRYVKLGRGFRADIDAFLGRMTRKVKVVYFCNPNNPTSALTSREDLLRLVRGAFERDVLVFLDEDFLEFVDDERSLSLVDAISEFPNLFVLRSFTKIFGLTGLRVGYGVSSAEFVSFLMNAKVPWNVNCLGQVAAVAALRDTDHLKKTLDLIRVEKKFLLKELGKFRGLKIYPPDANFVFMDVRKTGFTAAELKLRMLSRGVLIRDCSSFAGLDGYYIRVAVKTRLENERLLKVFGEILG